MQGYAAVLIGRALMVPFAGVVLGFTCCANDRMHIVRGSAPRPDAGDEIRTSRTVKLLSLNANMLPGFVGRGLRDLERARRICDRIHAVAPHVVVLQEVFDENVREVFSRRLRDMYPYRVEKCDVGALLREDSGLFLASRLPVLAHREVFESFTAHDPLLDERIASKGILGVWIDLASCGEDLVLGVFTTHLHADHGEPGRYAAVRREQLAQARRVIERSMARMARTRKASALLLGDLNVIGETVDADAARLVPTEEYRRALQLLPGAEDVVRPSSPDRAFYTWDPASNPLIEGRRGARQRLDHAFAWLHQMTCRGVELDKPALSDHYGLVVSLGLVARQARPVGPQREATRETLRRIGRDRQATDRLRTATSAMPYLDRENRVFPNVSGTLNDTLGGPLGENSWAFAALAQLEREQIGERTRNGMAELRRQGRRISRHSPFGFRFEGNRLVRVEGEQAILDQMQALADVGCGPTATAGALNADGLVNPRTGRQWTPGNVRTVLRTAARRETA
jgi:endonuclease/exonuclease/phosphatase family metal-dependent hydrolase